MKHTECECGWCKVYYRYGSLFLVVAAVSAILINVFIGSFFINLVLCFVAASVFTWLTYRSDERQKQNGVEKSEEKGPTK